MKEQENKRDDLFEKVCFLLEKRKEQKRKGKKKDKQNARKKNEKESKRKEKTETK